MLRDERIAGVGRLERRGNRVVGTLKFKSEKGIELLHDIDQKARPAAQQP